MNKRIFSGIQPSGNLHVGNYLGAIKNWVKLQDEFESIFCVVDMHAITVPQNPEELRKRTIEIAKVYLASGIDPKKSSIFIQSHIQEHAELAWILNTIAKMPELDKMTQFKDKTQNNSRESIGVGLYDYPILMAADILLYDAEKVPVGEDQVQHVELTRTLGKRFNNKFGETFVIPEPHITKEGMRIMGLDDPGKKMSKSAASEYNWIGITDDAEAIRKKIKKAVTDSGSEIKYQDDKPALKNLINIYSGFSGKTPKEIEKMYVGKGYGDFKNDLAEVIIAGLKPIQEKMKSLSNEEVLKILEDGASKVRLIAENKMEEVKKKIGFIL
ncbi:MAG TPA: tryptophan--tRNA ligase [Candidatus Moranbacteria bacterium]|nr:tryptophan--tRNA ligase [Candidatus Moranbacteria bacterium]HRZ34123.1 tryptophan--tRNA ligase [Candidatus Moranbacteria bacterium]